MDDLYPSFQDLFLQIRGIRKGDRAFAEDMLAQWEEELLEMDEIIRSRLFILCIAAEEGRQTAGEVAFRKKGTENCPHPHAIIHFQFEFRKYGRQGPC